MGIVRSFLYPESMKGDIQTEKRPPCNRGCGEGAEEGVQCNNCRNLFEFARSTLNPYRLRYQRETIWLAENGIDSKGQIWFRTQRDKLLKRIKEARVRDEKKENKNMIERLERMK